MNVVYLPSSAELFLQQRESILLWLCKSYPENNLRDWKEFSREARELADQAGMSFLSCKMFPLRCSAFSLRLAQAEGLQQSNI